MNTITKTAQATQPVVDNKTYTTPLVDIVETQDAYVLEAEMPGVTKSGVELLLERNELTIVGHRAPASSSAQVIVCESKTADFRRVFELDPSIDTQKIDARMEQGVLTLRLPKSEAVKPRKIMVTD